MSPDRVQLFSVVPSPVTPTYDEAILTPALPATDAHRPPSYLGDRETAEAPRTGSYHQFVTSDALSMHPLERERIAGLLGMRP